MLDGGFNKEVGRDGALYWDKEEGDLAALIDRADNMPQSEIDELTKKAEQRIATAFSWQFIADEYAELFTSKAD